MLYLLKEVLNQICFNFEIFLCLKVKRSSFLFVNKKKLKLFRKTLNNYKTYKIYPFYLRLDWEPGAAQVT